ncbi:adenylate/guanylate cyclase domain-containing protein [Marinobacterium aestuariivivens]|uniref:Adenylate/guanylate cyclase domain-containing protein n=1 Tax=Marinobacterium aestuariivivens TaxID=1698799 RepID=A0ABW2A679_9GAMM
MDAKFCSECGAPLANGGTVAPVQYTPAYLAERIRAEKAAMLARGAADGERKTITMLFSDLADSTELIQYLDAEEAQQLLDPVLKLMMEAVHHYEGYVAKSLGDGILALFGAPIAHEDHARRALYAALRMQHSMDELAERIEREKGLQLRLRIGIHSGEVVVRSIHTEDLHTDYDPVGRSIHIASRMETAASPGAIVVSEYSYRLTQGYFEFRALGPTRVKGVAEPIQIYELLGVGPLRTRLQVSVSRGLVPFFGRQQELSCLQALLDRMLAGQGQLVAVRGEPGVGKSRLLLEFKRSVSDDCLVLETFSVSHTRTFACWPLIGLLNQYFDLAPRDDARRRHEKIGAKVAALDASLEQGLPYLQFLLAGAGDNSPLLHLDPQTRRERTFEAIRQLLLAQSRQRPLVLIFEDLQWLDSETQAFLELLVGALEGHRLMLLVNYRPEYRDQWLGKSGSTRLQLEPLAQSDAEGLLQSLLGSAPELMPVARRILEKTEGNPFFIEEVVQTLAEEQVLVGRRGHYRLGTSAGDLQLPMTVQGVLAARIDRLPPDSKALLQVLAVIGKALPFGLVRQVTGESHDDLMLLLNRLQDADFIYSIPAFPEQEFAFKHALTLEVAYRSLLNERRSDLHERTARAIESRYRDRLDEHYGELAHHYGRSGNTDKAIEYLQLAGQQAVQRYANSEAIAQLSKALELIGSLPESPQRDSLELAARLTSGPALMATRGYAAAEVESTYSRALQLCRQVGAPPQLFPALLGLRTFYHVRGELPVARELSEQLVRLARKRATTSASSRRIGRSEPCCSTWESWTWPAPSWRRHWHSTIRSTLSAMCSITASIPGSSACSIWPGYSGTRAIPSSHWKKATRDWRWPRGSITPLSGWCHWCSMPKPTCCAGICVRPRSGPKRRSHRHRHMDSRSGTSGVGCCGDGRWRSRASTRPVLPKSARAWRPTGRPVPSCGVPISSRCCSRRWSKPAGWMKPVTA